MTARRIHITPTSEAAALLCDLGRGAASGYISALVVEAHRSASLAIQTLRGRGWEDHEIATAARAIGARSALTDAQMVRGVLFGAGLGVGVTLEARITDERWQGLVVDAGSAPALPAVLVAGREWASGSRWFRRALLGAP